MRLHPKGRMACGRFLAPALEVHPSICLTRAKQQRRHGTTQRGATFDALPAMRHSGWRG